MEKLARTLANKISLSLGYDAEKTAVIAYGLIAIIQIFITTLLVFLAGILAGVPVEALIVCFSVSIFRKYSGGAHAKTAESCTLFSVFYCTLAAVVSRRLLAGIYSPLPMAVSIILVFGLSFLVVYQFAPVDSPNKPIRTAKKRTRMRAGSFIILAVYFAISIMLFIISRRFTIFRSYEISMLLGISWQTFTLTSSGAQFIGKISGKEV